MGAKLDQVHSNLTFISSALTEAKKRKPKVKAGPTKGKGRKFKKQADTQNELGQGQGQFAKHHPHDEVHDPGRRPPTTPAPPAQQVRTPQAQARAAITTRPSTAVPTTPAVKASEPPRAPVEAPRTPPKAPAPPKAPRPTPKPQVVTEPAGGAPKKSGNFLQRVKSKILGTPRRVVGGALRRVRGLFRRIIKDDIALPRTLSAMILAEQRSSTTFKKCPKGAMISSPKMRHSLPKNMFVNPDAENPTFPIRAGCRASKGGVLRALQKDMSGAGESVKKQVIQRINAQGGTRGKDRIKAWGTGVGGKRMETFRGPPHKSKRTGTLAKRLGISKKKAAALHGISKGKPDMVKHTAPYSPVGGSKGPAGNREVTRAPGAHSKPKRKESKGKAKRRAASSAVTIARGKALAGR